MVCYDNIAYLCIIIICNYHGMLVPIETIKALWNFFGLNFQNLELTHVKFQGCGVLKVTASFTWEE